MIKTHVPQSPFLQNYIECFYVFNCESQFQFRYLAFSHCNRGFSFFKGVEIHRKDFQINVLESIDLNVQLELLGKHIKPLLIQYSVKNQEISIVFKPFGINRFLPKNYISFAPSFSQEYTNSNWQLFGETLLESENRIESLEEFLLLPNFAISLLSFRPSKPACLPAGKCGQIKKNDFVLNIK